MKREKTAICNLSVDTLKKKKRKKKRSQARREKGRKRHTPVKNLVGERKSKMELITKYQDEQKYK